MPRISVIVPIYNVEKYLCECLDSILSQTFKDFEVLLIDDGSTDNSPKIVDDYSEKDNRIIVYHRVNGGYGSACNFGLDSAKGEYISIIEPDDFIDKNMFEDLYNNAVKNNSDVVKSAFYTNLDTIKKKELKETKWDIKENVFTIKEHPELLSSHPSIWSAIYNREFLNRNNIRFVEAKGAGWTDNLFQIQTMCLASAVSYVDKAYYYWRVLHENAYEEIKDYTIPFKRSDEIHDWLERNNINDEKILAHIYKRELGYIRIVLQMSGIEDTKDCYERINHMRSRMNKEIILNSGLFSKSQIKTYKVSPQALHRKFKFRRIFKQLFKFT